jgi:hypothetical protein
MSVSFHFMYLRRRIHTLRAGVRVPSTSKRQMVFLTGRWSSAGMTDAATAAIVSEVVARNVERTTSDGRSAFLIAIQG